MFFSFFFTLFEKGEALSRLNGGCYSVVDQFSDRELKMFFQAGDGLPKLKKVYQSELEM
jgi:hypothetical protein